MCREREGLEAGLRAAGEAAGFWGRRPAAESPRHAAWPLLLPDINECLQLPRPCAYQCHNLQGSYRCLCPPGHTLLRDGKACTPLEQRGPNVTTVSHRGPWVPWLRPRAPVPNGSYHAWVSLRPGPRALSSMSRAWCPTGFIRQNGVCTGKAEPPPTHWGHIPLCCLGLLGWVCGHRARCSEIRGSQAGWTLLP